MINDVEYLIFTYIAELRIRLRELFAPDITLRLNLPHHTLAPEQLSTLVHSLLQRDFLELLEPETHRVIDAQAYPNLMLGGANYIGLTTTGGQAWEDRAKPDWCLYLDIDGDDDEDGNYNELLITSEAEPLILTSLYYLLPRLGRPDVSIIQIGEWYPVYWKTLSSGLQARITLPNTDPRASRIRHALQNPWPPQICSLFQLWRSRINYSLLNLKARKTER